MFFTSMDLGKPFQLNAGNDSTVLFNSTLPSQEAAYINTRREKAQKSLTTLVTSLQKVCEIQPSETEVKNQLRIGMAFSGGGVRSQVSTVGQLSQLLKLGLMDYIDYAVGLSGSTWALLQWMEFDNDFVSAAKMSTTHDIYESAKHLLSTGFWFSRQVKTTTIPSTVDMYSFFLWERLMRQRWNQQGQTMNAYQPFSAYTESIALKEFKIPYPILTCINVRPGTTTLGKNEWLDISPHWCEFPLYRLGIPTSCFGQKFSQAKLMLGDEKPIAKDFAAVFAGICGSAFCFDVQTFVDQVATMKHSTILKSADTPSPEESQKLLEELVRQHWNEETEPKNVKNSGDIDTACTTVVTHIQEEEAKEQAKDKYLASSLVDSIIGSKKLISAKEAPNFMKGTPFIRKGTTNDETVRHLFSSESLGFVDAGHTLNIPIATFMRQGRQMDVIFLFDNSAMDGDGKMVLEKTLQRAAEQSWPLPWSSFYRESCTSDKKEIQDAVLKIEQTGEGTILEPQEEDYQAYGADTVIPTIVYIPLVTFEGVGEFNPQISTYKFQYTETEFQNLLTHAQDAVQKVWKKVAEMLLKKMTQSK